jgi:hypothetical protein
MMRLIVYSMCVLMVLVSGRTIPKPPFWEKAETARWLAHANEYGTLSTTSVHLKGQAWGQTKSFADGSSNNSTGVLYFYDSDMDTSMKDIAKNPHVAFSLSAAQLLGHCDVNTLDPENPRCARVVFSGKFVPVDDPDEKDFAHNALFDRHPEMASWPTDHDWKVHKIDLEEIWLIDIFGGGECAKRLLWYGFSTWGLILLCKLRHLCRIRLRYLTCVVRLPAAVTVDTKEYFDVDMAVLKFYNDLPVA